jgi:hypothetical protein
VSYRIRENGFIWVLYEATPARGNTQNSRNLQMAESRIPFKEEITLAEQDLSKTII